MTILQVSSQPFRGSNRVTHPLQLNKLAYLTEYA